MTTTPPMPPDQPAKRKPGRPKGSRATTKRIPGYPKKSSFKNICPKKFQPNPTGRPPLEYNPEYAKIAKDLYANGATNSEVADTLGVSTRHINLWLVQVADFRLAAGLGKIASDNRVEASLYTRAVGYDYETEKVFVSQKTGKVTRVTVREHVPPDIGAIRTWLTNRRPKDWRDRREIEANVNLTLADLVKAAIEAENREKLEDERLMIDVTPNEDEGNQ